MARLSIGRVGQTETDPEIHGRSGLERAIDTLLFGIPGVKRKVVSTRGTRYADERPAINGYDVTTTIDITMQDILEEELGQMLINAKADWGTAILMEVATGDIKAISNLERDSTSRTPRYIEALNRAVQAYEPGSVLKAVSMVIALEDGFANLNQSFTTEHGGYMISNYRVRDTHFSPTSTLSLMEIIPYSSNISFAKLMVPQFRSDLNSYRERVRKLGLMERWGTGIAGERPAWFPTLDPKAGGLVTLAQQAFGYGCMVPPLYTCALYNAIANDGKFVKPRLMQALRMADGTDSLLKVSYVRDSILSRQQSARLREMMRQVVWGEGGTAKALRNPVVEIAGKTGTCKLVLEDKRPRVDANGNRLQLPPWKGGYLDGHYRVTFCGFFPFDNPRYTCIVVINDPQMPYRGPAVSSGTVLKNLALKMYARGMLEGDPVFRPDPSPAERPLVHTSFDNDRRAALHQALGVERTATFGVPASGYPPGQVPDVRGVSVREALAKLEQAGYQVVFRGAGFVESQSPAPGTTASPGTRVHLNLKNLN